MPFPVTDGLSLFLGPAENPLSENGRWAQLSPLAPPLKKNVGSADDSVHNGPNYSYWTAPFPSANIVEVWGCTGGGQLGAALETWRVALWLEAQFTGYLAYYGGAIGKSFVIRRYTDGSWVDLVVGGGGYPQRLGLRIDGNNVECWGYNAGAWSLKCSIADTTHRGSFYPSLGIEDPTGGGLAFSCFGGGRKNFSQIIRWITN
jgi:hypothetical protein